MAMVMVMARQTRAPSRPARPARPSAMRGRIPVGRYAVIALATSALAAAALSNAVGNAFARISPDSAAAQLGADPDLRLKAKMDERPTGNLKSLAASARA